MIVQRKAGVEGTIRFGSIGPKGRPLGVAIEGDAPVDLEQTLRGQVPAKMLARYAQAVGRTLMMAGKVEEVAAEKAQPKKSKAKGKE